MTILVPCQWSYAQPGNHISIVVTSLYQVVTHINNHTTLNTHTQTCPSIMYDIIIMESEAGSGNLSGNLVVSMS